MPARSNRADRFSTLVRAGYDHWAASYDDADPSTELDESAVRRLAQSLRGRWVADLGCGTGRYTRLLIELGARVVGVDLSRGMLDAARRRTPMFEQWWIQADLLALPLASERFDGVTCGLVVDHVSDPARLFMEVARILRSGGLLILTAIHPEAQHRRGPTLRFTDSGRSWQIPGIVHDVDELERKLQSAGLRQTQRQVLSVDRHLITRHPAWRDRLGERSLLVWAAERRTDP